jgi:hypothetical protein
MKIDCKDRINSSGEKLLNVRTTRAGFNPPDGGDNPALSPAGRDEVSGQDSNPGSPFGRTKNLCTECAETRIRTWVALSSGSFTDCSDCPLRHLSMTSQIISVRLSTVKGISI